MKAAPFRTPVGGRVDRSRPLGFSFDDRKYWGLEGDTLASALLANGVRVVGRSFRFHRPRGLLAAGAEEPNALVQLGLGPATEANLKATQVTLSEGLVARAVNTWPSARWDVGAALGLLGALPAGFYYKTFMWPRWGVFAPVIRRIAGLGKAPAGADPDLYVKTFAHCDVLIIGAGPAGLAAALALTDSGARVILVDDKPYLGGALNEGRADIDGRPASEWVEEVERRLAQGGVTVLSDTTASGWYDHGLITLAQQCGSSGGGAPRPRQRLWKVRARRVVLAAGAFERPLVFPNNDRPGVMLAGAARAYAVRFGVLAGRRAVLATTNDCAYEAALDLLDAGLDIRAIADARAKPQGVLADQVRARGVSILAGHVPVDTTGDPALTSVSLARLDAESRAQGPVQRIRCDLLAVSGGWSPAVHLFSQAGGALRYDEREGCFRPDGQPPDGMVVGAAAGEFTLAGALAQGAAAGREVMDALGLAAELARGAEVQAPAGDARPLWEIRGRGGRAWVDFQNDVTAGDVRSAAAENYASVEHLKRYTTLGMASDQGKTSNINGIGILSQSLDAPMAAVGTTRFRPPFNPVTLGVLAGRRVGEAFHTLRLLPSRAAQEEAGAALEDYAGWLRPARYPLPGETEEQSVRRECLAVRSGVGLMDASPLGKILVAGPDAGRFLDRIYVGKLSRLRPGRCRYGLMLGEAGGVMDDGVVLRLGAARYLVGTSSAGAEKVAAWLEEWLQCEWPQLDVVVQPVTGQWATVTIAGPASGRLLGALGPGMDVSDAALPPMSFADGPLAAVGGAACRVARVSYTGERSYEISVAADRGEALWRAAREAGRPLGATPFGIEALMRLRLEKGFLHVGADTEATTWPQDLGYGAGGVEGIDDFVGRRSALRVGSGPRRQLVGLETLDAREPMALGSHVVSTSNSRLRRSEGWVTSCGFSPTLGRWVALALVENGAQRLGEVVRLYDRGRETAARVRPVCSYDPPGTRLNA